MKEILSIGEAIVPAILEIYRSTIDFPATFSIGLGTVRVCGLSLLPQPAIGTIIFIFLFSFYKWG
jgi:hypothetical protein